ncbi:helix-turn-helix transcriptional regulator [Bacillus sp. PAMC26568]|nr:helix-turn-helix transcriptional regulator [Bacillus sp. PAMC26568]
MRIQADEVRELRRFFDMTQENLAEATRFSQAYVASIESGSRPITPRFEQKLIESLRLMPETIESIRKASKSYEEIKLQINGD